jgi:uncharacterized membrane protein YfcA
VTDSPLVLAALVLAAFCAGTIDAVAGGGGLLTLPALLAAGLPPHLALGTNKGQSVFGSGAAFAGFARAGLVDAPRARTTFPAGFLGSLAGALLVSLLRAAALRPIVLALLVFAAAVLALRPQIIERAGRAPHLAPRARTAAAIALAIGAYDGFFGPGTGTFLIIAFTALLGTPLARASADAKVVNFASNLAALATFAARGTVIWRIALPMAAAQLAGGFLGAHLAVRGGDRLVRRAVLLVVLALVVKLGRDVYAGG